MAKNDTPTITVPVVPTLADEKVITNPAKDAIKAAITWLEENRPRGNHPARPAHEKTLGQLRSVLISYEKDVLANGSPPKGG